MLSEIRSPKDLSKLTPQQRQDLAGEIRREIIETVIRQGGHLSSNLGNVELTIALETVFSSAEDRIVFDVGHQCYTHKILTGRHDRFSSLRDEGGISGFPSMEESVYDAFSAGHASTAISAALGYARARDIRGQSHHVIAVVGDGALTGGMCYEALNDAGQSQTRLIVVLNDNEMSISKNVGAMSSYLTSLRQSRTYRAIKRGIRRGLDRIPVLGPRVFRFLQKIRNMLRSLLIDGRFFEALGIEYIGPIDGSDIERLIRVLNREKESTKPVLIHVVTQKGKGYPPAEENPAAYHGISPAGEEKKPQYSALVGECLAHLAREDSRVCAITAAMASGTGLSGFAREFPDRFFDVGIAEEHAVTLAGGMAASGMRPFVAIYSTFLERAYDQILVDICRNRLPVTFLIDRAGLVGADGATHQGVYDLAYLRNMPNMIVSAPRCGRDFRRLVRLALGSGAPFSIRYPREETETDAGEADFSVGQWEALTGGEDGVIFAVGSMVEQALGAADKLESMGFSFGVVDARFIKPMDEKLLTRAAGDARVVVTMEEGTLSGGFGEEVAAFLSDAGLFRPLLRLGVPDRFVPHADVKRQLLSCDLDAGAAAGRILAGMKKLNIHTRYSGEAAHAVEKKRII